MSASRLYPTTPLCDGDLLALFEPTTRDTDVFITTSAKCGQTWLQALLFHLKTRGLEPKLRGLGLHGVSPWLELPGAFLAQVEGRPPPTDLAAQRQQRLAEFERLDDPRVFKLHVLWEEVPRRSGSKARVVTVTRDPRDVPWSMFSHFMAMKPEFFGPAREFDAWFEEWFERGFYFSFLRSMWPHRNDPDVLFLRYEDLHENLAREVGRLVTFLGWPEPGPEELERVMALVQFGRMSKDERGTLLPSSGVWKDDARFFREGAVGKNRARLKPEQERRILERARAEFDDDCYRFVVTLD